MAQIASKDIKIKAVIGEPKGYIARAIKADTIKTDDDGIPVDGQAIPLCFVVGRAREKGEHGRVKVNPTTGEASKDTWPVLLGDFECIPVDPSRDTHRAPKAFLAEHIINAVAMTLADLRKAGEIDPIVELAMRVEAVTDQASSAGFVYRWVPLHQEKPAYDPMAEMRKLVTGDAAKALPAPEKADAMEMHNPGEGEPGHRVAKGGKAK